MSYCLLQACVKKYHSIKMVLKIERLCYCVFVQDLQSAVERISLFLGKELTDEQLADVVKHSTFKNMRKIPQANYEQVPGALLSHHQGRFMRKGKRGLLLQMHTGNSRLWLTLLDL